jgi:hypothetical protein
MGFERSSQEGWFGRRFVPAEALSSTCSLSRRVILFKTTTNWRECGVVRLAMEHFIFGSSRKQKALRPRLYEDPAARSLHTSCVLSGRRHRQCEYDRRHEASGVPSARRPIAHDTLRANRKWVRYRGMPKGGEWLIRTSMSWGI